MPIYEYHCSKCGCDFEELVMSSSEKIKCPECKSAKVKKQMSRVEFQKRRQLFVQHRRLLLRLHQQQLQHLSLTPA